MTKSKKPRKSGVPSVDVYFPAAHQNILEVVLKLAKKYNISESRVGLMAIRNGLKQTVEELDTQETKTNVEI